MGRKAEIAEADEADLPDLRATKSGQETFAWASAER
jgi:hypothetical protein